MKSLLFSAALAVSALALASSASADVVYNDAAVTATHDCGEDPEVSINGSSSTLTLVGTCTKVAISGSSNKVTIQASDKVSVSGSMNEVAIEAANKIAVVGSANQVSWKKGLKGAKPKVSNVGTGNKISKAK